MTKNFVNGIRLSRGHVTTISLIIFGFILVYYGFIYSDKFVQSHSPDNFIEYIDLRHLLSASIDAAKRGGIEVFKVRESISLKEKSKGKTREGVNDPVTDGDMKSHIQMYFSIQNAFPQVSIISEEKSSHKFNNNVILAASINSEETKSLYEEFVNIKDIQVWIDPLDATQEYTENLLQYVTTMVCVAVRGEPMIGVVHKPFENTTAWAWVGRASGAGVKFDTTFPNFRSTSGVRAIVSRSHRGEAETEIKHAFGEESQVTPAGGAGYKVLEVLSGAEDLYFHSTLIKKWDICAGNALLNHFGGRMTTLRGINIDYSDPEKPKNEDGLLATLHKHDYYLQRIDKTRDD